MSTSKIQGAPAGRRRRPWTAAEKTACLRAFAASGQSATAFCRAQGVPRATLTLWRRTAGAPAASAPPPGDTASLAQFARVTVVACPTPPASPVLGSRAPAELPPLTLALRTPDGLEAVLTGLGEATAVAVLRGVLAPRAAGTGAA